MTDRDSSRFDAKSKLPGRPWAAGAFVPPTRDADVDRWTQPHSVVIARSDEAVAITMFVLLLLPRFVLGTLNVDAQVLPDGSDWGKALLAAAATFVPLLGIGAIWMALNTRSGGWITIDPNRRRVEWRRMKDRDGEATAEWSFDEIRDVQAVEPGRHFSGLVVIELPEHAFRVRVPHGFALPLAESLGRNAHGERGPVEEIADRA